MLKKRIVKKCMTSALALALAVSAIVPAVKVEAAGIVDDNTDMEYHVVGRLYNEMSEMNPNVSFSFTDGLLRKPGNGTYLFTLSNVWSGRKTNVYENGYSKPKKFVQYVSSVWAKRSQYTENQSSTVSWTRSSNISLDIADGVKAQYGLATSATASLGFGSMIPADPTKYSKLALYADFHDYYLKCIESNAASTEIYNTYYGDVLFPTNDFYYVVEYQ